MVWGGDVTLWYIISIASVKPWHISHFFHCYDTVPKIGTMKKEEIILVLRYKVPSSTVVRKPQ